MRCWIPDSLLRRYSQSQLKVKRSLLKFSSPSAALCIPSLWAFIPFCISSLPSLRNMTLFQVCMICSALVLSCSIFLVKRHQLVSAVDLLLCLCESAADVWTGGRARERKEPVRKEEEEGGERLARQDSWQTSGADRRTNTGESEQLSASVTRRWFENTILKLFLCGSLTVHVSTALTVRRT